MSFAVQHPSHTPNSPDSGQEDANQARIVLQELDRILKSRFFKNAVRSRQFLEYIVRHKLDGHAEQLKERTIGTELFQRSPGYATGDDPVVRVQAGEVRRRLQQYYQSATERSVVRIELPVGSYAPQFHWLPDAVDFSAEPVNRPSPQAPRVRSNLRLSLIVALCLIFAVGAGLFFVNSRQKVEQQSRVEQFWAPVFATQQPVLICLAKPIVYRPTLELYKRYSRSHPDRFQTEVERSNQILPLGGNEKLAWSELMPYPDYGVAVGDAYAAVRVSALLGKLGKPSQVRIGTNYSFEDLRNSPAVIMGAFNNKWTMQITPGLHFAFVEVNGEYMIREQVAGGRVWHSDLRQSQQFGDDYAIVARLLDSKTGQFTIIAAGLTGSGTQSAGEFVSNPDFLERGLRGFPPDWQKKNMELVLQTSVTDSTAGPPQVLASYSW